jgi:hypothetical protein
MSDKNTGYDAIPTNVRLKKYSAKRTEIGVDQEFSRFLRYKSKFSVEKNEMRNTLYYELTTYIHTIGEENVELYVKYPMDWWEAFKERWFSKWLLVKYPVKYKEVYIVETKYKAVCPHLIQEDKETHLKWMASTVEWDDFE